MHADSVPPSLCFSVSLRAGSALGQAGEIMPSEIDLSQWDMGGGINVLASCPSERQFLSMSMVGLSPTHPQQLSGEHHTIY